MNNNTITVDRSQYHLYLDMIEWCKQNIGPGEWSFDDPKVWRDKDPNYWVVRTSFGYTTFSFRELEHFKLFLAKWTS